MAILKLLRVLWLLLPTVPAGAARATTLEQVISHEQPAFQTYEKPTRLTVGKDGRVYVGLG